MKGIKFSEKICIRANRESVFDFTQDYKNRLRWDTFLKNADLLHGADKADLGVKALCVAQNGLSMETEYVSFNRPKVTAIKMTKGPIMFRSFLGSWAFKELEEKETEVTFLYTFTLRFPFSLWAKAITKNLQKNVKRRLVDLKTTIERSDF